MTDRQEATTNAWNWATTAEEHATAAAKEAAYARHLRGHGGGDARHRDKVTAEAAHQQAQAERARDMATMWASIARLLPAVLPDTEPEPGPCDNERPVVAGLIPPAHCILPTGHRGVHTDPTGSRWQSLTRCPSRYEPANEQCGREQSHPGAHQGPTVTWPNPADTTDGPRQHPDTDQCRSRHETPDGLLRCDRKAGHHGVHSHPSCQWPNQANAATPTSPSVPVQRKPVEDIDLPETGPHTGSCCQQAVVHVAEQLLEHARTAPGLTNLERRCLEDAADFVRAHMPAQKPTAQALERPNGGVVLAARHLDATEGIARVGHCLSASDVAALTTVLRYVSRQHNAAGGRS